MKRWMALLLTGCLVFQTWVAGSTLVHAETQSQEGSNLDGKAAQAESVLEVEVRSSLLIPYKGEVTVHINDGKGTEKSKELDFNGAESLTARFDVAQGDYTVSVQTKQFADYTQQVSVEAGWLTKILVCAGKVETGSASVPGWICPGDVNQDGIVNEEDTEAILKEIRENPQGTAMDINQDGKTDIADLQYIVQSLNEERKSQVQKLGVIQGIQAEDGTAIEGNVEAFLNNAGAISLKPLSEAEPISAKNPVSMKFALAQDDVMDAALMPMIQGITLHAPTEMDEDGSIFSNITDGEAVVVTVDENGREQEISFPLAEQKQQKSLRAQVERSASAQPALAASGSVSVEADGSLVLNFGTQIAVKRVTIRITGTKKTEPLVNIAKVEFVNNMEERIPAPQLDIPTLNEPQSENKGLTVSWNAQRNITGYEVYVSGPTGKQAEVQSQIVRVSGTQHRISSINNQDLKNFQKYTVKVRSVNGDWHSPWSEERIGEPKPQSLPAAPDNVSAVGGYRTIKVSWKDMDDSNGYMVFYKKSGEADSAYRPVVNGFEPLVTGEGKIDATQYVIGGLEDDTEYSLYVRGWNELGWGKSSLVSVAATKSSALPQLPKYKLLNTSNGAGVVSAHIVDAVYGGSGGAQMVGSALDTEAGSALGLVDDDYGSYWMKEDWDDGVAYPADTKGMTITLDKDYEMNYFTFAAVDQQSGVQTVRLRYWNTEHGTTVQEVGARLFEKRDKNNLPFYIVKTEQKITANKIYLCLGRNNFSKQPMMVGEIHFHQYDSLEEDIMNLYEDEMHTTLRSNVTEGTIAALEDRLNTADSASSEKHPLYSELLLELNTARDILNANLKPSYVVDNRITAQKDGHLGFGGLNAWQPLGKTAYQGEKLLVFVGHNTKRTGDSTNLQLVFTQHHAEASSLAKVVSLKIGRNEITVPQITSNDFERGGQLYVAYTGNSSSDQYAVRIGGGSDIPALNLYGKTGSERTEAIQAYVGELETYVAAIQQEHEKTHTGNKNVDYEYSQQNCILNATDIMMHKMMYSLPATKIWDGIKNADDKAAKLDQALQAMEQTMTLFYQHKGLSDEQASAARGNNALPVQHLNIRYMRMFAGAFMYASGNHIGIEWGSCTLASAPSDWSGFGWGIAHEIGHNINQGSYAVAEVTNNYFAQLLTGKTRYTYENVYRKVTSGTVGRASNVFTQLALYWQLHLAFDDNADDRHIYDSYEEQFQNLFCARVDTYSRNPQKAPQSGLALNGGADQNLMRLACAAANKNILPFFERWGMVPDSVTTAYAEKYGEADTKAIYYVNEDARDYRLAHAGEEGTIKDQEVVTADISVKSNQVQVTMHTQADANLILGYEISRSMISNGEKKTEVIGFVPIQTADTTVYVDTIASIDNRVMGYEVRAVDKYLNYSGKAEAGSAKIKTDGILDKSLWTVTSNMTSEDDIEIDSDEENPDNGSYESGDVPVKKINSIERILDNDRTAAGTFTGNSTETAVIEIDMHKTEQVTSLKYQGDAVDDVAIEVSADGETWTSVKEHYAGITGAEEATIWFDSVKEDTRDEWIGTYDARYVRITLAKSGSISIQEVEICGPSGDNLEFMTTDDAQPAIGILSKDYRYGDKEDDVIPQGSLIFSGNYKGNPAYNVVILYDTQGNVIGAKDGQVEAKQVIFADVPEHGNLGETSNGTWVYYVEPANWDMDALQELDGVRGELYRVDDAQTLEGERIVSDTLVIQIPSALPSITLQ